MWFTFLLLASCLFSNINLINESKINLTVSESKINRIIRTLSLEQKIGQLLIYGFKGKNANYHANKMIKKYNLGGVIIFSHNVKSKEQVVNLTRSMQKTSRLFASGVPLFISVDQEGGKVLRLKNIATTLPGNMNLGASKSSILSYLAGKLTSIDLEALGINMNFAPVIDVNTSKNNNVIGVRSFGDNPNEVARLGVAYVKGLQSRRVSATAKHFPGHGSVDLDSHFSTPLVNKNLADLYKTDLKPFIAAIKEDVDAIMTAHVSLPKIDSSNKPATISKTIMTKLLREKLGFKGLIITDDMEMNGVLKTMDIGKAAVQAFQAGCDLITVVWSSAAKRKVFNSLYNAVKNNTISQNRLNESLKRIIKTKLKRKLYRYPDPNINEIKKIVNNKFHNQIAKIIAKKSITLIQNNDLIPLNKNKKYLVISSSSFFLKKIYELGFDSKFIKIKYNNSKFERNKIFTYIKKNLSDFDHILISVINDKQSDFASYIKNTFKKPVIVASLDSPYLIDKIQNFDAFLCSYSYRTKAISELANVLAGKNKAYGKLPVKIN